MAEKLEKFRLNFAQFMVGIRVAAKTSHEQES